MATSTERLKILKLVQERKISAEEGIELLDLLSDKNQKGATTATEPVPPAAHWFRVVITDMNSGKARVNVRLPLSLVNAGMKMGAKFSPQVEGLDKDKLNELLHSGVTGKLIDVYKEDEGEHVEVYID